MSETITLAVTGMTCGGCARSVERKLAATPGVSSAVVNLEAATVTVQFDPERTPKAGLIAAIETLGFQAK